MPPPPAQVQPAPTAVPAAALSAAFSNLQSDSFDRPPSGWTAADTASSPINNSGWISDSGKLMAEESASGQQLLDIRAGLWRCVLRQLCRVTVRVQHWVHFFGISL